MKNNKQLESNLVLNPRITVDKDSGINISSFDGAKSTCTVQLPIPDDRSSSLDKSEDIKMEIIDKGNTDIFNHLQRWIPSTKLSNRRVKGDITDSVKFKENVNCNSKRIIADNEGNLESSSVINTYFNKDGSILMMTYDFVSSPGIRTATYGYKQISVIVSACNSAGGRISDFQTLDIYLTFKEWLFFIKVIRKSKFLKGANNLADSNISYEFNLKIYDEHELNISKSLSNYSDAFIDWYSYMCRKQEVKALDIENISKEETIAIDNEWCKPLY